MTRLRVRFSKFGKVRFTSHRDVARIWERTLRRGDVAVAYTEGFSPRPKLSFGLALSTGYESYGEYLDIVLGADSSLDGDDVSARVAPGLPDGIEVQAVAPLDPGTVESGPGNGYGAIAAANAVVLRLNHMSGWILRSITSLFDASPVRLK